ncbi:MAG: sulfotransferase [Halieaceae bacterium]|nr:sulfotransferase [Halieaceae bacterium]
MNKRDFVTSTNYRNPYRPLPVRALNSAARLGANPGLSRKLRADRLIEGARRKTGLGDFGGDGWREALEVLVESINREASLSFTGRLIQRGRLGGALVHRLRAQALLSRHPEILDTDLGRIIMITGLQRTGTTVLHRLLHTHPDIKGITGAEALGPVPKSATANSGKRGEMHARAAQRLISWLSPDFQAIHPIEHAAPEEDVILLDLGFMSQTPEAIMHVPTYSLWLEQQDHTESYRYFRKLLQILSWQWPTRNWVLKTPHHLEYLDVFHKVFPEATVVQTHRDPRKTLPSFCSMVAHGRAMFSDHVDPHEIGRHWRAKTCRMVDRAIEHRSQMDPDTIMDVSFYDLMDNPLKQFQRICRQAGIECDNEAVAEGENYLRLNPRDCFGRHAYDMADFGLSEALIEDSFSGYRQLYEIPIE